MSGEYYLNGSLEQLAAAEKFNKEMERNRQLSLLAENLATDENTGNAIKGVIVGLGAENRMLGADITFVSLEEDESVITNTMKGNEYTVDKVANAGVEKLSVYKNEAHRVSYDVLLGKQDASSADIINIAIGGNTVRLRISGEKISLAGHEVPKIYAVNKDELFDAYFTALDNGNIVEAARVESLLTPEEKAEFSKIYPNDRAEREDREKDEGVHPEEFTSNETHPASVQELAEMKLMKEEEQKACLQETQESGNGEWQEKDLVYAIDTLEGDLIRAQSQVLTLWDENFQDQVRMNSEVLFDAFANDAFLASFGGGEVEATAKPKDYILAALPQIKGEFTREEFMVLSEQLVISAMHRAMIEGQAQGAQRKMKMFIRTKRFEAGSTAKASNPTQAS